MPAYTRNKKRENTVYVAVNSVIRFGWKSKDLSSLPGVSSSELATNLGHVAQNAITGSGIILVIGAQSPKPARVTKKLSGATSAQQQSVSTFCAHDKLSTAIGTGWNIASGRRSVSLRASSAGRRSLTAIATLTGGIKYAFPMNKADFDEYGAALGLESAATIGSTERDKLVSGSSKPRPGRASRVLDDGSTFSSFYSTAKLGDATMTPYDILSEELVLTLTPSGGGGS